MGILVIVFGFFFVTVSSRIVGIIGTSSNPVSGMTIATLMGTCLLFVAIGWVGDAYQAIALCVGGMVCIAASNAGNTSQDLKTGYIVGATPRHQQVGLMIGVVASVLAVGFTVNLIDKSLQLKGVAHAIGSDAYPAPQANLMATIIKGLLAQDLPWGLVFCGMAIAVVVQMCGVRALSFAVGLYLPLSTTLPIFIGGMLRWWVERKQAVKDGHESELSPGMLFLDRPGGRRRPDGRFDRRAAGHPQGKWRQNRQHGRLDPRYGGHPRFRAFGHGRRVRRPGGVRLPVVLAGAGRQAEGLTVRRATAY